MVVSSGCARSRATTHSSSPGSAGAAGNPAAVVAPITNTDPCASQMHDIAGWLLLYFARHNDLPADLAELGAVVGETDPARFTCPVSGLPYIYDSAGLWLAERNTWVVVHDAAPSHASLRWSITIAEPVPGMPLVTKVIALPESFFLLRPPP